MGQNGTPRLRRDRQFGESTAENETRAPSGARRRATESTDREERERDREYERGTCPECESASLSWSADGHERVCDDCGLVVETERIDRGPEWRGFSHEQRRERSRVGRPQTHRLHDRGLTTDIDWSDRDAAGRLLSAERRKQVSRLRTWQERIRTRNASERSLRYALSEIDRMASALGVPESVREVSSVVYRRALDADLVRGRSIEGVATAALYTACRREGIPRSLAEVTSVSRVERTEIGRTYRFLASELGLGLEPVEPRQFLPRFASALELDESVVRAARQLLEETGERGLHAGRSPAGLAAAALYTAARRCGDERTQREAADVGQVTANTIRKRHREYEELLGDEFWRNVAPAAPDRATPDGAGAEGVEER